MCLKGKYGQKEGESMIEKEYLNPFYEELEKLIGLEHTEVFLPSLSRNEIECTKAPIFT